MNFYKINDKILISNYEYTLNKASEEDAVNCSGPIFVLTKGALVSSRMRFRVSSPSQLFIEKEGLSLLKSGTSSIPKWLEKAISQERVISINTNFKNWESLLEKKQCSKAVVTVTGMGDVGGILTSGLRLQGYEVISKINIFDMDMNKIRRWELECNAILPGDNNLDYPEVAGIEEKDLFNCDLFVFCVSTGVPGIGMEAEDVRLAQLKGNSNIIANYARLARERGFKGIFAVVSDPVDLLCKAAYIESNKNSRGELDFLGLKPDQIKGYGLGVMYARAAYYSSKLNKGTDFLKHGRAFGPHGEGLIIADSIDNYNERDSELLTEKARGSNLEVRAAGYKPYIAPALSSGALSLIATLKGNWHYSTNFIGGVFFGSRNRETNFGLEFEAADIPDALYKKMEYTYNYLKDYKINQEV